MHVRIPRSTSSLAHYDLQSQELEHRMLVMIIGNPLAVARWSCSHGFTVGIEIEYIELEVDH